MGNKSDRFDPIGAFITFLFVSALSSVLMTPQFEQSARAAVAAIGGK